VSGALAIGCLVGEREGPRTGERVTRQRREILGWEVVVGVARGSSDLA
jgi:hypothetical protein